MPRLGLIACLALSLLGQVKSATPRRIHFGVGKTVAEVKGRFTAKVTDQNFVLRALSGQHMKVEIKPISANLITAGEVTSPSGHSDGAPGGVVFDSDLSETGDYRIRVFERQQALPGTFVLRVECTIHQ